MGKGELRLLVITELFLPTKGGTAVWFAEVYPRLAGKSIHILTADVPGARDVDESHPNTIHRLRLRRYHWLKPESLLMYAKFCLSALGLALRHGFDGIHAGRVLPEGLVGWVVARLIGKPFVVYAHGEELTTWGRGLKFRAMAFTFRHADLVVANSDYTQGELLRMGIDPRRIVLIYPGVDVTRFRPGLRADDLRTGLGLGPNQKLLLSVGRLQRRKGFDMLIRCIPALVSCGVDVHYALVGRGEDRDYLEQLASSLGVAGRVHFLGHVSSEDLPRWYNACDVFAMPNREVEGDTEGFGMVFLEAGACGKPVVAGRAGGTAAAVIDGITGLRVDGGSVSEITEAIYRLQAGHLSQQMGSAGHRRAITEFSWERVATQTLRFIEENQRTS